MSDRQYDREQVIQTVTQTELETEKKGVCHITRSEMVVVY